MDYRKTQAVKALLYNAEKKALASQLVNIAGSQLLQLGGPTRSDFLAASNIPYKKHIQQHIESRLSEMLRVENNIDLIVMPHVLEEVMQPKSLLDNAYRLLAPGGALIVIGFNPFGLWRGYGGKLINSFKMRRWLTKQGFDIEEIQYFLFRPPLVDRAWQNRLLFLEVVGEFLWTPFGGVYMLVAKKAALGLTPITLVHS